MWASVQAIPGLAVTFERGSFEDYQALAHLHYAPGRPATWAGVWRVRYRGGRGWRVAAVGVLSFAALSLRVRDDHLGLAGMGRSERGRWLNANLRTISRVIVHPQFRGLGLAARMVRHVCGQCDVRYVDALAAMGDVHPLFERGGMRRLGGAAGEAAYFLFDREAAADERAGV